MYVTFICLQNSEAITTSALTNNKALEILHGELQSQLESYREEYHKSRWKSQFSLLNPRNAKSSFHWTAVALLVAVCCGLLIAIIADSDSAEKNEYGGVILELIVCVAALVINIWFSIWNARIQQRELYDLAQRTLVKLNDCIERKEWKVEDFPHLHMPISPCISLQWTVRGQDIVNLPMPLLVKGDVILLRPGQVVPARCKGIEEVNQTNVILNEGDIYFTGNIDEKPKLEVPQGKVPLTPRKYQLLETPFVKKFRMMISNDKPCPESTTDMERYYFANVWIERRFLPFVLIVMFLVNILRFLYLKGHVGKWTENILLLQIHSILPLISLFLPILWRVINSYGQARIFAAFQVARSTKILCEDSFSSDSDISEDEAKVDIHPTTVLQIFWDICMGRSDMVTGRLNVAHILGSVTSLCCVDKKGLLSWPNPSAEKVFFLHHESHIKDVLLEDDEEEEEDDGFCQEESKEKKTKKRHDREKIPESTHAGYTCEGHVEVLDITHKAMNPFELDFDDPTWHVHLPSLKPLGLNILANTCNRKTIDWYSQFTDHVACEALENKDTVAVVNRRCLCELAKKMGFTEKALDAFILDKVLGLYRQVSEEEAAKEKIHRAKSFIHHQIPMPNMVSVMMREKVSGSSQVLSQGTADILMDCCSDYWNGEDVCTLTENDRKKILDFYHRNSMASYCTAFSYRPMTHHLSSKLGETFIELPQNWTSYVKTSERSCSVSSDVDLEFENNLSRTSRAFSVDSLFDNSSISSVEDVPGCCQTQSNQVFIGMVTMQYQARQQFVQLIDKLEIACIRFVHFSQENEVRSRVFSEKMGLEAGWNCHISLKSDLKLDSNIDPVSASVSQPELSRQLSEHSSRNSSVTATKDTALIMAKVAARSQESLKSRSQSAPSVVNLELSQVRFQTQESTTSDSSNQKNSPRQRFNSEHCQGQVKMGLQEINFCDSEPFVGETTPLKTDCFNVNTEWTSSNTDNVMEGESRHTSSYFTEDSLTGALDNRAKLPRGIENIRPHLQNVDNVPLLVNLFTDCTADTTKEMMQIMQESGEVVVCVGSSHNVHNSGLFLQADCSIAVEPLYPVTCAKQCVVVDPWSDQLTTPIDISSALVSLPCPLKFSRDDNVGLIQLIAEARTFLMSLRNCFYLILCYHISLTVIQVFASVLLFPPVLASHHLLWLLIIVIPVLGLSMMGEAVDFRVMNNATRKNPKDITMEMFLRFLCYYGLRFLPSLCVCMLCYALTLHSFCTHQSPTPENFCPLYQLQVYNSSLTWYDKYSGGLVLAQNVALFFLVVYFVCISVSFVHWSDHLWQQLPVTNKLWSIVAPILILVQCVYFACDVTIRTFDVKYTLSMADLHPAVYAVGFASPVVIIGINELVKKWEVKLYARYQKRTRLSFGTKLGMNSPF
ncbi:hypothetical protein FSP39_003342 [Pinctada imbricata]|uniref:Transmembrane protein 94 n=1 Tax=Pinctada imbricata TaxID=66713 RepID=A0AA88XVR5_PINIB|nr:hypothetical protein FSP39_003342 [Pinctada imbricata]